MADLRESVLELARPCYDEIVDHARDGTPEEVCGVLAGTTDGDRGRVEGVVRAENAAAHPWTTYRMDPEELFAIVEGVEDRDRAVVGFYHSHPAGPREPSRTDVARATWTDHVYLIVSLDGSWPFLGAWVWDGESFVDEPVRVV